MAFLDWNGLVRFKSKIDNLLDNLKENLEGQINDLDEAAVKSVNSIDPDENGNVDIKTVDFANNLLADDAQSSTGEYIIRTTGGDASLSDGDSWIMRVRGNRVHEGYVAESLNLTVVYADVEERDYFIAAIDRDTWVSYVQTSGTTVFTYDGSTWSPSLTNYGITVNGTPISGDRIQVEYTKENRGTIYTASPTSFTSTGWNLYNNATGYARVVKYSDTYGYKVGGTYTSVQFSETPTGTKTTLTPDSNNVVYPTKDGYIWMNGGNSTSTYVYPTWSDWGSGYEGSFKAYTPSVVSLADAMSNFPYGLCRVEDIRDEIAFESEVATSRINRLAYTASNLATVIASGMPYEYDTNYIYVVRETPITYDFTLDTNLVQAADHGLEWFEGTTVPVEATILYGQNLKDLLRHDLPTQVAELPCLVVNCGTISSLPTTISNTAIKSDMVVLNSTLGTPSAQTADWTVTTANGSLTISGSISGSTTLTLYLMKSR